LNTKNYLRHQEALTLIEVLVAASITIIILSIITGVYALGLKSFQAESIKSGLQTESRTIIDRMSDDIRLAVNVTDTILDPVTKEQYNSSSKTLILKLLAIDKANNILYDRYDYIIYIIDVLNRKITKRTLPHMESARSLETQTFLLDKVSDPSYFSYYPENPPSSNITSVTVNLKVDQIVRGKTYSYETSSEVKLRNK
jgi:type II secretory pathway pseudopilin PulG